jgi:hypothetical protein
MVIVQLNFLFSQKINNVELLSEATELSIMNVPYLQIERSMLRSNVSKNVTRLPV